MVFFKTCFLLLIDKRIKLPHDGYLKLFQLENPDLQLNYEHDVLMIDEGQDMNPTVLDIFRKQNSNKVIVGDPNQQIYTFRRAVNALGSIQARMTQELDGKAFSFFWKS